MCGITICVSSDWPQTKKHNTFIQLTWLGLVFILKPICIFVVHDVCLATLIITQVTEAFHGHYIL